MAVETVSGVLKLGPKGSGSLCDPAKSLRPIAPAVIVPNNLARQFNLATGALVVGPAAQRGHTLEMTGFTSICGLAPEKYARRTRVGDLVAVDPTDRFDLGITGDIGMRAIDLLAPIGKGTRALIVSPPKAGKTMILEQMARAIRKCSPETRVIAFLIDERPEEVTQFRRATDVEVFASSMDQTPAQHVELAEATLAVARAELECGHDIVLLVDSLTRMGRAFNQEGAQSGGGNEYGRGDYSRGGGQQRGSRAIMSGGLQTGALEIPRRFFGLARKIENGGSVTIAATVLVDTNSRMDEAIFQEFKGTGNCEIVLDRALAESRIFPALDFAQTGTRKEELLLGAAMKKIALMRRALIDMPNRQAIPALIKQLEKHPDNAAFLASLPG